MINKKIISLLILASCVLLGYWVWLCLRPVEIVDVHQESNYSDVLVRDFPLTNNGKIKWWLKNKDMLKSKYNIPKPDHNGYYTITFWNFGEGYKGDENYTDRLCFDDMKTKVNCIEKEKELTVDKTPNHGTEFTLDSGYYKLNENGDIQKIK